MKSDAIALGVQHDRPKTMWTNGVLGLKNLSATGRNRGDSLIQPSLTIQIQQWSMFGWPVILRTMKTTTDILITSGQKADRHARVFLFHDRSAQDRGIKADGSLQINYWDIDPHKLVCHDKLL
jgi:hypothetical protein